ncbi:hypothetical protein ACIRL3_45885 [Streptomyces sp. NPDC102384]|uniref:hypothetical protein n=1 Tax=Streptomyces sp. NPDC102384 TaxID=3366166 RepID=UPI00380ECC83
MSSFIPARDTAARGLATLTLDEAHELLRLLQLVAVEGLDELSEESNGLPGESPHVLRRGSGQAHAVPRQPTAQYAGPRGRALPD